MKILKNAGWLVLVFAVGVAGVYVGTRARDRFSPDPVSELPPELALEKLPRGQPFPDVPLRDAGGRTRSSAELVRGGCVALFLDLDCSPCTDLALRWQAALDQGVVQPGQVWGICYYPREYIAAYVKDMGLTLPVYQDSLQVFRTQYHVERFPLAITVGQSGMVRDISYDSVSPIDVDGLVDKLSR